MNENRPINPENTRNLKKADTPAPEATPKNPLQKPKEIAKEIGGPKGPEPTRYGDWERKGRCVDF